MERLDGCVFCAVPMPHVEHRVPREGPDVCDATVPGEPKVKKRPQVTFRGAHPFVYTPSSEHEKAVKDYLALVVKRPAVDEVDVELVLAMPDHRRCDIDNLAKLVLDAANGIVWKDDSQIVSLHVALARGVGKGAAMTRLRVRELVPAGAML